MSQSWFEIELITTPPECHIVSPPYVTQGSLTELQITSNRELSSESRVYIIDSQNIRHECNCLLNFDTLHFDSYFGSDYTEGQITIYSKVVDTVGNTSSLASKSMLLMRGDNIVITSQRVANRNIKINSLKSKKVYLQVAGRKIKNEVTKVTNIKDVSLSVTEVRVSTKIRNLKVNKQVKKIEVTTIG